MNEASTLAASRSAQPSLRAVLLVDAATCALMAVLLLGLAGALAPWLGLTDGFLRAAGALLLPCALLMWVAARQLPAAPLVALVVAGNLAWVAASLFVAFAIDGVTIPGALLVTAQAIAVLGLAWLEWRGLAALRR